MLKALTAVAPGSGFQDTNLVTLALSRDANKSMSGTIVRCTRRSKTLTSSDHSKLVEKSRDKASAVEFNLPGIC